MNSVNTERAEGQILADQLFRNLQNARMRIGGGILIGTLCREGFLLRLAELLEIGITITEDEVAQ